MFSGLYNLIVAFIIAAIIWYTSTLVPNTFVQKLGMFVAAIVVIIGLVTFLKPLLGA